MPVTKPDSSLPRCIFTATTGRSGSNLLAKLLSGVPSVTSLHEPKPNFVHAMRLIQMHPEVAAEFIVDEKLPAIRKLTKGNTYCESSHVFSKGFLEAWLAVPELPVPDLILLNRDYRDVALSMLKLGTTPGRTVRGVRWYLSPEDPSIYVRCPNWQCLTDYQLCYWYCLEVDTRKTLYAEMIRERGGIVAETSLSELTTDSGLNQLTDALELPRERVVTKFMRRFSRPVNQKTKKKSDVTFQADQLDHMEQQVREQVVRNESAYARLSELGLAEDAPQPHLRLAS